MSGLFALFKGEHGVGKTVGALSFPNPILLDHDKKMPAIANKHFPGKEIRYKQFKDVLESGDLINEWLNSGCPFDTIISDSITSLSQSCMSSLDDYKGTDILKKLRDLRDSKKKNVEMRGFDYYNMEDSFLKWYLDKLKILWAAPGKPHHVILIAHVLVSEHQELGGESIETRRIVTVGNKIAGYIPAQFDDTFHFLVKPGDLLAGNSDIKRICSTQAIGRDFAKTAYNLPTTIDFTNGSLFDKLKPYLNDSQPESLPAGKRLTL